MDWTEPPVGIVGAGPVGLACALRLATLGIPSTVLEAEPKLRKQGSRACCIQGDVVEILDKFGCADPVAAEGIAWNVARTYVGGKQLSVHTFPDRHGFAPFINISQYRTQQLMLEVIAQGGPATVQWSQSVTGVHQDPDGVTVESLSPDGVSSQRFSYLVACDGIHSELRRLTGVAWTGYSHGDRFLITDLRAELAWAHERHFHYDPPFNPGRQVVMHAQPDHLWRIDWQLPTDTDIEAERADGRLEQRIRAVIGAVDYEIDWLSTYRFHQRVVEHMRLGRIFFAGDAAHALPPYGARGMNSGIQDVDNLAWKLALVLRGRADDALLDTYHDERHSAAQANLAVTESTIRFMVPPTRRRRWARNMVLAMAPALKPVRRHVNSGKMAEPHTYADSPIVDARPGASPLAGCLAPDGMLMGSSPVRLRRLLGREFAGLVFAADLAGARAFVDGVLAQPRPLPLRLVIVAPPGAGAHPAGDGNVVVMTLSDASAELRAAYGMRRPGWFLIRPDGHIAAGREGAGGEAAQAFLEALGAAARPAMPPSAALASPPGSGVAR